jgi:hypothetical protein
MFIAAKVEEIHPPDMSVFTHLSGGIYTTDDLRKMEARMLSALGFELVVTTPIHLFDVTMKVNQSNEVHKDLCRYLLELALTDPLMILVRYLPSHLVAAATLLSNELLGRQPAWPAAMEQVLRCSEAEIRTCTEELWTLVEAAPESPLQTVRTRYTLERHHAVAEMRFHRAVRMSASSSTTSDA